MAQSEGHLCFDLDLAVMDDEALVVLAKECEFGPARDELIVRYRDQTDRMVRWLAHCRSHGHADVEDALQNLVFWIVEAINKYDTNQIGKANGCSFRSFIFRVVNARFKDFAKHLRRVEGHYDRSTRCSHEGFQPVDTGQQPKDPAQIAESRDSMNLLQATLQNLSAESAQLWQLLSEGKSLKQTAKLLGVSYDSVKRRRRKLIVQLKLQLKSCGDSTDFEFKNNPD
jgi:RNA polymerase sigma factor (sigma-70 family)